MSTATMDEKFRLRVATGADVPALHELIALSVRGLMTHEYSATQLEAALGTWLGVDTDWWMTERTSS